MADTKISALSADTLTGAEETVVVEGGASKKVTLDTLRTFVRNAFIRFGNTAASAMPANTTWYVGQWASIQSTAGGATDIGLRQILPRAGVVKRLHVQVTTASGAGQTHTVTIQKNGVDTTLVVTLSNTLTGSDLVNSFSVVAGDNIGCKVVTSVTAVDPAGISIMVEYDAAA